MRPLFCCLGVRWGTREYFDAIMIAPGVDGVRVYSWLLGTVFPTICWEDGLAGFFRDCTSEDVFIYPQW